MNLYPACTKSSPPHARAAALLPPEERSGLIRYIWTTEGHLSAGLRALRPGAGPADCGIPCPFHRAFDRQPVRRRGSTGTFLDAHASEHLVQVGTEASLQSVTCHCPRRASMGIKTAHSFQGRDIGTFTRRRKSEALGAHVPLEFSSAQSPKGTVRVPNAPPIHFVLHMKGARTTCATQVQLPTKPSVDSRPSAKSRSHHQPPRIRGSEVWRVNVVYDTVEMNTSNRIKNAQCKNSLWYTL